MQPKIQKRKKMSLNTGVNEVLRAVSMPRDLDAIIEVVAFHERTTISELIPKLLKNGLESYRDQIETLAPGTFPPKAHDTQA